jgi:thioredoxin-dependent adenylylsulfate APS reductase
MEPQTIVSVINAIQADEIASRLEEKQPQEVLAWAVDRFGERLAICSGLQAEGCVLIDMAWRIDPKVRVFTLDTGRLPYETHGLIDRIRDRYGIRIEIFVPEAAAVEDMVARHGNDLFRHSIDLRLLCCQVRKVQPLRRALSDCDAWVTGLRREQSETRTDVRKFAIDHDHGGIVKLAPLADWSEEKVWSYIRSNRVPYNLLYEKGYRSIGCAPCTRAVAEGEDPRAGRWWWESGAPKECGIHCSIESGGLERKAPAALANGATNPADENG